MPGTSDLMRYFVLLYFIVCGLSSLSYFVQIDRLVAVGELYKFVLGP